jgi:hypothetical protein
VLEVEVFEVASAFDLVEPSHPVAALLGDHGGVHLGVFRSDGGVEGALQLQQGFPDATRQGDPLDGVLDLRGTRRQVVVGVAVDGPGSAVGVPGQGVSVVAGVELLAQEPLDRIPEGAVAVLPGGL